jgi:c-di-GMP-binding flagellar brake protein YcgR
MMPAGRQSEFRNSVRFPLQLQVTLKTPRGEFRAKTRDISAGGILFHLDSALEVGSPVEFAIEMPAEMLGTNASVEVNCTGRVVRCLSDATGQGVAVVIDEYHFKRFERPEKQ